MKYWKLTPILILLAQLANAQGYNINGDASDIGENCYIITPALSNQSGSIWYNQEIDLNEPFDIQFTANFDGSDAGADGIVFVFQQVSNTVIGADGEGMGFSGFQPSLGIEFDIYQNGNVGDLAVDHMAILQNGSVNHNGADNLAGPIQASVTEGNIEDGEDHIVQISWDPVAQIFSSRFDCEPRLEINSDIINDIFNGDPNVFWGFTGATGASVAEIRLCLDPFILGLPELYTTCPDEPVQIIFSESDLGTYSWEPAEFLNDATIPNPIATVSDTTTFVLTYTDLCGVTQIDSTTVNIEYLEVNAGQDFNLCPGLSQDILLPEGYTYTWSNGFEGNPITISEPGTYIVNATLGNCFGSDTVIVGEGTDVIAVNFTTEPTICGDMNGSLTITEVIGSGGPYTFDIGGAPQTDTIFSNLDSGFYTLTATSPDGCIFTENFTIESILLVEAGFSGDPLSGVAPLVVNLTDMSTNNTDFFYVLDGNVLPNTSSITFNEYGTYTVAQVAWNNSFFCADTAYITVVVDALIELVIPNVVTPNSDGFNDTFVLTISGISNINVMIYNRWGNLIHEKSETGLADAEVLEIWDPSDVNDGTYYYVIEGTDLQLERVSAQGNIEVMGE
jgi:gliding motility-associated-like protein